jgi:hypothetical protein
LRDEDVELQRIMEGAAGSVEWVDREFAGVDLGDPRLDRRLINMARQLARSPSSPINEACGDWASTQASYRLFNNPKASPERIRKPHVQETLKRMSAQGEPVLVLQDTVFFSYGKHPKTKGLGPIGHSNRTNERGLIMHNALAFSTSGVPLGILSQMIWAREAVSEEDYQERIERLQCQPIEEKESSKWLVALRETVERSPAGVEVITVADRESDCFEFLAEAEQHRASYLIRARTDRRLVAEDSEGYESLMEALTSAAVLGCMEVKIPGNGKRKARTAKVAVRAVSVTLKAPRRRGEAKARESLEPISVQVIGATESDPPAGQEPISWVLLTNLAVKDFKSAAQKIDWYTKRWGIETWHKVLKSGCKVEECLLETAQRLARYLSFFSIIGVRLMHVTHLARAQPGLAATAVFSQEEIEALYVRLHKSAPPPQPPSLREVVRMIGRLGGHLDRKCDGEPGVTVLWRGWQRLYEDVHVICAHKQTLGLIPAS